MNNVLQVYRTNVYMLLATYNMANDSKTAERCLKINADNFFY